jgi:hypothetical protein
MRDEHDRSTWQFHGTNFDAPLLGHNIFGGQTTKWKGHGFEHIRVQTMLAIHATMQ